MRLCPQFQDATDPTSTVKFDRVRIKQAAFLANVYKTQSFDIGVINFNDSKLGDKSLRDLTMDIRSTEDSERRIFVSLFFEMRLYFSKLVLDAVGISECNVHWKMVPIQFCLPERTRGWWESMHLNTAYYSAFQGLVRHQAGGVSLWSINKGAHRVMESGVDARGLGRWAWTRYRGKQGINLRLVTAYRPVLNKTGVQSVWN